MNNAIPHDPAGQEYISELSRCSFYFPPNGSGKNTLRATLNGADILLIRTEEKTRAVDAYISIPANFNCVHYKSKTITSKLISNEAHLSYHGTARKKKITGEIHVKNNGINPLQGQSEKLEAPIASSSNISIHPLPICRLELSGNITNIQPRQKINNFFEVMSGQGFFNTIEIHLARRGYLHHLAAATHHIPEILASIFSNCSLHTFYLGKMERRPGLFPQALALQTDNFELIVLATHEYKNESYGENSIRYFYTKDYFQEIRHRTVYPHDGGWFVGVSHDKPPTEMKTIGDLLEEGSA